MGRATLLCSRTTASGQPHLNSHSAGRGAPPLQAVANNKGGSYMTMFSKGGFIFGVINIIGNFGTVFGTCLKSSGRWRRGAGTPLPSLAPMLVFFHT